MEYSRIFGSNFPNSLIEVGTKKDIDDTVIELVNQYTAYINSGNIGAANTLYQKNKDVLDSYSLGMKDFNLLLEEIHNIGVDVLQQTKIAISLSPPATMSENSIWYEILEDVE